MELMKLTQIEGIETGNELLFSAFATSLRTADELTRKLELGLPELTTLASESFVSMALNASLLTANSILGAMAASCNLDAPPAAVNIESDNDGSLVYRCQHPAVHKWKLDGTKI